MIQALDAEIEVAALEREVEASRTLLAAIIERSQQTVALTAIEKPDARVLSPATIPGMPSFPQVPLFVAAALVLGVMFGLLVVWFLEQADSTIRSGEEVRSALGLPCLALVPMLRGGLGGRQRPEDYVARKPLSPFAESMRALRAALWLGAEPPRVIVITAARPGEGKTTTAVALARSAAMNGERALLVDCDVRQPSIGRVFRCEGAAGVIDLLLGQAVLERIIRRDHLTALDDFPAGAAEIHSLGLFMSEAMAGLLDRVRQDYDLIVLDAPPRTRHGRCQGRCAPCGCHASLRQMAGHPALRGAQLPRAARGGACEGGGGRADAGGRQGARALRLRRRGGLPPPLQRLCPGVGALARYLVTGGAGYVGSHLVLALIDRGEEVVVLDDLRQGHRAAVPPGAELVVADIADRARLAEVFAAWRFEAVFHFAALSLVGESMRDPLRYIRENVANSLGLAEAAVQAGCLRFVLSSTAALFGEPERVPIDEAAPLLPTNAYGQSKLMVEQGLAWAERAHGLRSACLRYFNAAGADPLGRIGEDHDPETHLVPLAIGAALGTRPPLTVFGTDYPTPDGTCIRDYIHVADLAEAHLGVLPLLEERSVRFNLGSGAGYTVRQVIEAVERVGGRPVPHSLGPRRAGDPAALVASSDRLRRETGWAPRLGTLDDIVRTAWAWHEAHPRGYDDRGGG